MFFLLFILSTGLVLLDWNFQSCFRFLSSFFELSIITITIRKVFYPLSSEATKQKSLETATLDERSHETSEVIKTHKTKLVLNFRMYSTRKFLEPIEYPIVSRILKSNFRYKIGRWIIVQKKILGKVVLNQAQKMGSPRPIFTENEASNLNSRMASFLPSEKNCV